MRRLTDASKPKGLRASLAVLALAGSCAVALAGDIHKGATMQVKANSIWFLKSATLTHWQQLKRSGSQAELAAYQEKVLRARDAWQFLDPLTVRILAYEPKRDRVHAEMKSEGRLLGTDWWLDAGAFAP